MVELLLRAILVTDDCNEYMVEVIWVKSHAVEVSCRNCSITLECREIEILHTIV